MAESQPKKSRRKKRNAKAATSSETASPDGDLLVDIFTSSNTEALEESLFWYNGGSDDKSQTMAALRLEVLGPFLFSRAVLCDQALGLCRSKELLLSNSGTWPQFFDKSVWSEVTALAKVMAAVQTACEADDTVYQAVITGEPSLVGDPALGEHLKRYSAGIMLRNVSNEQVHFFYSIIATQGKDFGVRAGSHDNLAASFLRSLTDKVKLVDPVKDRGNSNFKQQRFKAAIADYSTAIKLCPYSPVLYCNRALCYLRNKEYWHACIDSFRALFLHPSWEKPYYRCAEAWYSLGHLSHAVEINHQGQLRCSSISELHGQLTSFMDLREDRYRKPEGKDNSSTHVQQSSSRRPAPPPAMPTPARDKEPSVSTPVATVQDNLSKKKSWDSSKSQSTKKKYTELEELQCPEVDPRLSCAELRKLCNQVKLDWCSPAAYFSAAGSKWEEHEPEWVEPTPPITDPLAEREPMLAKFDEIWCPVLADIEESLTIIPPTFQYFSDGTVMHSAAY